jgi:hypothetical protein
MKKMTVRLSADIFDYCNTVITREMTVNVKPHPDHLFVALQLLDALPERSSMVGDHPMDIKIGKRAGTLTIGVLTGYSTSDELKSAGADIIMTKQQISLLSCLSHFSPAKMAFNFQSKDVVHSFWVQQWGPKQDAVIVYSLVAEKSPSAAAEAYLKQSQATVQRTDSLQSAAGRRRGWSPTSRRTRALSGR